MKYLDPDVPFLDLDLAQIGDALVRFALTARQLGHKSIASTVEDYSRPGPPEHNFVRDAFLLTPQEMADRWFGGDENAVRFTSILLDEVR